MGTSGPLSAILKFGTRRTSNDVTSATIESGMVENVGVAVGISLLSYPVTEIQSTSGILTAILFSASQLMSANMENHSNMLAPALFDKFSTKPSKTYKIISVSQIFAYLRSLWQSQSYPVSSRHFVLFPATPDIPVYDL